MASNNGTPESGSEPQTIVDQEEPGDISNTHMGELDKVRSILFGEQIKVYEERIARIEEGLKQNLEILGADINQQIKALDERFKSRYDEILELLGKETHSRENQKDALSRELEKMGGLFDAFKESQQGRLNELNESMKSSLQMESQRFDAESREKVQALSIEFKEGLSRLEQGTLNRAQFADLLAGMAEEISPSNSGK